MKLIEIKITSYDNWIRYNDQSLKDDFVEYQKKETSKWKTRAKSLEFRFPIFKSLEDFKDALDNAKIIDIDKSGLNIENMTTNNSIESIKHFQIFNKSYEELENVEATWFIDPPYQHGGEFYTENNINFSKLAEWCKTRKGQVIVCENDKANWLDFKPLISIQGQSKKSTECIWTNK